MKTILCVLLLAAAVFGAEEKKNEKRGVLGLGLGYGLGHGLGHGLGYGLGHGLPVSHGLAAAPLLAPAPAPVISTGYYGHGLGLYGHGLYGHGLVAPPVLGHSYGYSAPLLGLGHGWH